MGSWGLKHRRAGAGRQDAALDDRQDVRRYGWGCFSLPLDLGLCHRKRMNEHGLRAGSRAPIEFSTHNPENIIVIEHHGGRVLFRAAHDNFSERRKAFLIRQLAAEGYIPDQYERLTEHEWAPDLLWVVDHSLIRMGPDATRRVSRFMQRLIMGGCLLWCLEVLLVLFLAR